MKRTGAVIGSWWTGAIGVVAVGAVLIAALVLTGGGGSAPRVQALTQATPGATPAAAATPVVGATPPVAAPPCWLSEARTDAGYMQWDRPPERTIDPATTGYVAAMQTSLGTIRLQLLAHEAPTAVNNFVCLARIGYYDNSPFHRVLAGFVIQGGDPTGTGAGDPGYQFQDELPVDLAYTRGALAMANAGPNTNGSQFFIVLADLPPDFPPNYTIFGQVIEGMEVVDQIAAVEVGPNERGEFSQPLTPVTIQTVTIEETAPQPVRIRVGGNAVVGAQGATLRSAPGESGVVVAELPAGATVTVLGAAELVNNVAYRLVQDPSTRNVGFVREDRVAGQP